MKSTTWLIAVVSLSGERRSAMKLTDLDVFESMEELENFIIATDAENEQWRATCKCCSNCKNCYEEYGQQMCCLWDDTLDNPDEDRCEDWR